ncbi:hypothetical protein ATANTOWER_009700, partial [Ataeniobius toweri]|nr:hypothetical protein [Ataeniobius toweri]
LQHRDTENISTSFHTEVEREMEPAEPMRTREKTQNHQHNSSTSAEPERTVAKITSFGVLSLLSCLPFLLSSGTLDMSLPQHPLS